MSECVCRCASCEKVRSKTFVPHVRKKQTCVFITSFDQLGMLSLRTDFYLCLEFLVNKYGVRMRALFDHPANTKRQIDSTSKNNSIILKIAI